MSLDQIKRALETWVRRPYPARVKETRESARHLVSLVANGEIYGTRLAQQQVEAWLQSKDGSKRELAESLAYAYDSMQAANGPSEVRLTPGLVALHVKA